ncbi:MAG TPA: hypothetical protein VHD62_05555 [Opitutaceae bacterium]|nr:hypothetical protein [Opitutaceae bacterium]
MKTFFVCGMLGLCIASRSVAMPQADEARGWLHLDGYTHHFDAPGAESRILGVGFTWYVRRFGVPATAWEADLFQDSACKLSGYAGRSWTLPLPLGNIGVTGALMYHRNFAAQNRWRVLPVALPFWELSGRTLKLRAYYIPPVRSRHDEQIALQVLVPWWR